MATVVVTATVAFIPVVAVADVGAGVCVTVDVCADDARYFCCCKVPGAGVGKADVDGR